MEPILGTIPPLQRKVAAATLPGIRPVGQADWVTVDQSYSAQIQQKTALLAGKRNAVLAQLPQANEVVQELLAEVLKLLRTRPDFVVEAGAVICPDGRRVSALGSPLRVIAQLLQEDIVIHQPVGVEHGMTAALLCFPASWTLAQKIGKPLTGIHAPVTEYDINLAKRVQRLFDGVQVGHPIWRANLLRYDDPALFQPRTEEDPRPVGTERSPYERSERQTLFRLPQSRAVVFAIHTVVAKAPNPMDVPGGAQ